jgi:hypothetical protein
MTEPTVELDHDAEVLVLDIAVDDPFGVTAGALSMAPGELMRAFDLAQVAGLKK